MSCEKGLLTGHKISGIKFVLVDGKSRFSLIVTLVLALVYYQIRNIVIVLWHSFCEVNMVSLLLYTGWFKKSRPILKLNNFLNCQS